MTTGTARPAAPNGHTLRSEQTRRKVLEATIDLLSEDGFARTSTLAIQARAGLTRGRLLHQFGSKNELLMAAVQYIANERFAELTRWEDGSQGTDRIRHAITLLWESYSSRLFWAAIELLLAARHDEELRKSMRPVERALSAVTREMSDSLFGPQHVKHPNYLALRTLLLTSMRGVAVSHAMDRDSMAEDVHPQIWYELACDRLEVPATVHV